MTGLCEVQVNCKSNSCPPGKYCNKGKCHDFECYDSNVCTLKYEQRGICYYGTCIEGLERCINDICPKPYKCINSVCVKDTCKQGEIFINDMCIEQIACHPFKPCPSPMKCSRGMCIDRNCPAESCPPSFQCISSKCIPLKCYDDEGCMGSRCDIIENICRPPCPCPAGQYCSELNYCLPKVQCDSFLNCKEGEICFNRMCKQVQCMVDEQCPNSKPLCIRGVCSMKIVSCNSTLDCSNSVVANGLECVNNACTHIYNCPLNDCLDHEYCSKNKYCVFQIKCIASCPHDMYCEPSKSMCMEINCNKEKESTAELVCPDSRFCNSKTFNCEIPKSCQCKANQKCINENCYPLCDKKCEKCNKNNICITRKCSNVNKCDVQKYCDPELGCNIPPCYSKKDCKDEEVCLNGICVKERVEKCDKKSCGKKEICRWSRCLPEELQICTRDMECPYGFICNPYLRVCYPRIVCIRNLDCAYPTQCSNGYCEHSYLTSCMNNLQLIDQQLCIPSTICLSNSDCPLGEFCRDKKCSTRCNIDSDCPLSHICGVFNVCTEEKVCDTCTKSEICVKKQCHQQECSSNFECPPQLPVCYAGTCIPYERCSATCKNCINNICVNCKDCPAPCKDGSNCQLINPCDNCRKDEICRKGQCKKVCSKSMDCPSNTVCLNGECTSYYNCPCNIGELCFGDKCIQSQCFTDSDCPGSEFCLYGSCQYREFCIQDEHCPVGYACLQRVCIKSMCNCKNFEKCYKNQCYRETICYSDRHCPQDMKCNPETKTCEITNCQEKCASISLKCSPEIQLCIPIFMCFNTKDCKGSEVCNPVLNICEKKDNCYLDGKDCPNCEDVPCPNNFKCIKGKCQETYSCLDFPCQAPQICIEHQNQFKCITPGCNGDKDCPYDMHCSEGRCVDHKCNQLCSGDKQCRNGICQLIMKCPCQHNFYCGKDQQCYPERPCNPNYRSCNTREKCVCTSENCYCQEIVCTDVPGLCKSPEICSKELGVCIQAPICSSASDCINSCCDLLTERCVPCCRSVRDCLSFQNCENGQCVTIMPGYPSTYKYNEYYYRIECRYNEHCPNANQVCFYGICIEPPEKCGKFCNGACIGEKVCIILRQPWTEIVKEQTFFLSCNGVICIPRIICYNNDHCPKNTECGQENYCEIIKCGPKKECKDDICQKDTCIPSTRCNSKKDCKGKEVCINGECTESCELKCSNDKDHCSLLTNGFGVCITEKGCKINNDCPPKHFCVNKKCERTTPSCPFDSVEMGGVCHTAFYCTRDNQCLPDHICHQKFRLCLKIDKCHYLQCEPGQQCEDGECVGKIQCREHSDCPDKMECFKDRNRQSSCAFVSCHSQNCRGPYYRCIENFKSRSVCTPVPICTSDAQCFRNEKCINYKCVKTCEGNCVSGEICINNVCIWNSACNPRCGIQEYCHITRDERYCRPIECTKNIHCPKKQSTCFFGKCVDTFRFCELDRECPPNMYCQPYKDFSKSVCLPMEKCNQCNSESVCVRNTNICVPKIVCELDFNCPEGMQCEIDSFGNKICLPISCESDKDCPSKYCSKSSRANMCIPLIEHFECFSSKDCKIIDPEYECVHGECSKTKCLTQIKNGKLIPSDCNKNQCFGPLDCPIKYDCIDGTCHLSESCKNCKNKQCLNGECIEETECKDWFNCPNPYICIKGKCTLPEKCVGSSCPCFSHGVNCPDICIDTAISCPFSSMECKNGKCLIPVCTRDSQCNGLFCIDGKCEAPQTCSQSTFNCICLNNVCISNSKCPCPTGYECYRNTICLPTGVKCSSNIHCPEHMKCRDGICKYEECNSENDCSYTRICGTNGELFGCAPSITPKCTNKQKKNCVPCKESYHCPELGMICKDEICTFQESCENCKEDEECVNGECLKRCKKNCSNKQRCNDGQCISISGTKCPKGEVYDKRFGCHPKISCLTINHCPSPTKCELSIGECINYCKDEDCPPKYKCVENMCIPVKPIQECFHQNECTAKTYCDNLLNNCKDYCDDKSDCEPEEVCINRKCVSENACGKCPEYYRCLNDKCVPIQCIYPYQCGRDSKCRFGTCVTISECKSDFECPWKQKCIDGRCSESYDCDKSKCDKYYFCHKFSDLSACIPEISCNENCPIGMKCFKKKCIPDCDGKTCKLSEYCLNGKCTKPEGKEVEECKVNKDCPRKHVCKNGVCEEQECFYDNDCPKFNNICINYKCLPPKCFSHRDCNTFPYTFCDDGQCIDNRCNDLSFEFDKRCTPLKCPCMSPFICKNGHCNMCSSNKDCPPGTVCEQINKHLSRCQRPLIICVNEQCGNDQICWNGQCKDRCNCKEKNSCGVGSDCVFVGRDECACLTNCKKDCNRRSQQCIENKCIYPSCSRDTHCQHLNEYCSDGVCMIVKECKKKSDCPKDLDCIEGVCIKEKQCENSGKETCISGKNCIRYDKGSICLPEEVFCLTTWDCPEMMECQSNVCKFLYCSNDYNCNSPMSKPRECKNGVCIPKLCSGNKCDECNNDKKCEKPLICVNKRCQVIIYYLDLISFYFE